MPKLTDEDIRRIRHLYSVKKYSVEKLGREFEVSTVYIRMIVNNEIRKEKK